MTMCAIGLAATMQRSNAAGWSVTPRASLNTGYDDNVRMSAQDQAASGTAVLQMDASLLRASDVLDLTLAPQFTLVRYDEQTILNRDDYNVVASAKRRRERAQWALTAQYVRDTTLTSELGSTGYVETNAPHENLSVSFSPSWTLTERWNAGAQASWSKHEYPDADVSSGLVDYDYRAATARTGYAVNEQSWLALDASYGRLIASDTRSENYAANLSLQSTWGEHWQSVVAVGPTRAQSNARADDVADNGIGYSFSVDRRSEIIALPSMLSASWSRDVTPTGRGLLSKRERVVLGVNASLSERASASLSAQWTRNQDLLPSLGLRSDSVRYTHVTCGMQWRFAPTLSAAASVGWTRQLAGQLSGMGAEGYRASVGIVWNGLQRSL